MEARLKKDKAATDLKTGEEIVLLDAGTRVEISDENSSMVQIAPGQPFEGLWLARHEVDVLLTVEEVAERVDRHVNTVLRWLGEGRLEGFKVSGKGAGGQWRVPEQALEGFVPPKPGPKPKEGHDD